MEKCKQGIIYCKGKVLKRHKTEPDAVLERRISELYKNNGVKLILIPKHFGIYKKGEHYYSIWENIKGISLMGNSDFELAKKTVIDLALFHERFSQNPSILSSSVLYRDAINSNYILKNHAIYHIDFSSCNKFVHCFDDLALLLNPNWNNLKPNQTNQLINDYLSYRYIFNKKKVGVKINVLPTTKIEKVSYYHGILKKMEKQGFKYPGLEMRVDTADYQNINPDDYNIFDKFRKIRAEYYIKKWGKNGKN